MSWLLATLRRWRYLSVPMEAGNPPSMLLSFSTGGEAQRRSDKGWWGDLGRCGRYVEVAYLQQQRL